MKTKNNYKEKKNVNKNWIVEERKTGYILGKYKQQKEAQNRVNMLNKGFGFNGETPAYIGKNFIR